MYRDYQFRQLIAKLHNGPDTYEVEIKHKRLRIMKPRLNFATNVHPMQIINMLEQEKNGLECGQLYKFIITAPKYHYSPFKVASYNNEEVDLQAVLFLIYMVHKTSRLYKIDEDVLEKFKNTHNSYSIISRKLILTDSYIG